MSYQAPFYSFSPLVPPLLPQSFPIPSSFQSQSHDTYSHDTYSDAGMQPASWEQSIPFATPPLSFSPSINNSNNNNDNNINISHSHSHSHNHNHNNTISYQQSEVDSADYWGPVPSPPISASAIATSINGPWIGPDEPIEDEIPLQSIVRCRSGYQCQVPVGDTGRPCGHIFSRRDRALTHVRVHFGMRSYTCQGACGVRGCNKSFFSSTHLRAHVNPARAVCSKCRRLLLRKNLKRHMTACAHP